MALSASRVASRYLLSREWGDLDRLFASYNKALAELGLNVAQEKSRARPNSLILKHYFAPVVSTGRVLAAWAVETRTIPDGKAKALELAARLMGLVRIPSDIIRWYETNLPKLEFLRETIRWKERSAEPSGGLGLTTVGPFKVHNTIGAKEKQFKELQGLVKAAVKAITPVMDFKKVLYGDVFVVGQLRQSRTAAWYFVNEDQVYLRSLAKKGVDDLASLIHELGHRYWFKFASAGMKRNISGLFYNLASDVRRVPVPVLKAGDILPLNLKGELAPRVITKVTPLYYELGDGVMVKVHDVEGILKRKAVVGKLFPSAYSMKNDEEFFAECFSFYVLGKLPAGLVPEFEKALK